MLVPHRREDAELGDRRLAADQVEDALILVGLEAVFGDKLTEASDALPWLGMAMALLACAYLSVQYLLAMGKASFLFVLAAGVLAEVGLLLAIGDDLTAIAIALFAIQAVCASIILTLALRQKTPTGHSYAQV